MVATILDVQVDFHWLLGVFVVLVQSLGIVTAIHAVMTTRTPQGAIAWLFPLVLFPYVALPMYWIFGRSKFSGYIIARRFGSLGITDIVDDISEREERFRSDSRTDTGAFHALERLAKMPFTHSNQIDLLIDGQATFDAILEAIDDARDYILFQFFIIHDDDIGREVKAHLIERAEDGVTVLFLYDEIGCHSLPNRYLDELRQAGVTVEPFHTTKGNANRFQLNFRNHRKIVIVDGEVAFIGGHNVGDEYLGRSEKFHAWRDTHVRLIGPSVQCVQLSFLEDWYWAAQDTPNLNWMPETADEGEMDVLVLPSGPADRIETCGLFFVHAIHSAKKRVWIASPYFVPDTQVIAALQLAALRGVDVRIMLPEKPDHKLVYLSSFSFLEQMDVAGVKIYRYQPGFLHQKVLLVDDNFAAVGTANLDNRSFRLNFEITVAVVDLDFAAAVHEMLANDFANCRKVEPTDFTERSFLFRLAVKLARLTAPIQ